MPMPIIRGQEALAKAVKYLCKVIGNNPDVVAPDTNVRRRAVYDAVIIACDLFDEFIPDRVPPGGVSYSLDETVYSDGITTPTNFDRSAGRLIYQLHRPYATPDLFFSRRIVKSGVALDDDMMLSAFLAEVETAHTSSGQALANAWRTGCQLTLVAIKRNIQGHEVDEAVGDGLPVYTSTTVGGNIEPDFVVTTMTYKDHLGNLDRLILPGTLEALGKRKVHTDSGTDDVMRSLCASLIDVDSFLCTRKGQGAISTIWSLSTISNEALYKRFYAVL